MGVWGQEPYCSRKADMIACLHQSNYLGSGAVESTKGIDISS